MSSRSLFRDGERAWAEGLTAIAFTNPFLEEREELERKHLGREYSAVSAVDGGANADKLLRAAETVLASARSRLGPGSTPGKDELELYEGLALFTLYHRWREPLRELLVKLDEERAEPLAVPWYARFRDQAVHALRPDGTRPPTDLDPPHLLSLFFQISRAFHQIDANLVGTSRAATRLRAQIWQSIFTHDIRRYRRVLYRSMADVATLVTGPSGSGKELVARAVGRSGYLSFDERKQSFDVDLSGLFLPLNVSALSPQLVESELFGYRKGAFTGALQDRPGWFEACLEGGSVFLDEIGEIAPSIQVKLLRVLQTRRFQRIGDTRAREFRGKLISATNRDLATELEAGRFREDLYYRICSDHVETPSLAEQVHGDEDELRRLLVFISRRQVKEEAEALADESLRWIEKHLTLGYAWPGNFRELEQCVRSVLVREEYRPRRTRSASLGERLAREVQGGELSAEALLRGYCTLVYSQEKSFDGAARRLGLDRRTVRAKVDPGLLDRPTG